jgi:hypothetical protein
MTAIGWFVMVLAFTPDYTPITYWMSLQRTRGACRAEVARLREFDNVSAAWCEYREIHSGSGENG